MSAGAHGFDQIAGHSGERHEILHLHFGQGTDDLVNITAGAEVTTGATNNHRIHISGVNQRSEQVAQFGIGFKSERIFTFWAVKRDGADTLLAMPQKVFRLIVTHHGCLHSFLISYAVLPPSMAIACPVTLAALSEHSQLTDAATSLASMSRP